jgi:monoamine oxidase
MIQKRSMFVYDHVVIGAGLSGLYATREILKVNPGSKILILEANDRIGGRIFSSSSSPHNHSRNHSHGHDWGATWMWPDQDRRLMELLHCYKVTKFEGDDGEIVSIDINNNNNNDNTKQRLPSQLRFIGGASCIIAGLYKDVADHVDIRYEEQVIGLSQQDHNPNVPVASNGDGHDNPPPGDSVNTKKLVQVNTRHVQSNQDKQTSSSYMTKSVIVAVPPRLILRDIHFSPPLPNNKRRAMETTPTWMEKASKAYLTFHRRVWDPKQLPISTPQGCAIYDVSLDDSIRSSTTSSRLYDNEDNDNPPVSTLCVFNLGIPFEFNETSLAKHVYPYLQQAIGHNSITNSNVNILQELKDVKVHNWASQRWTSVSNSYDHKNFNFDLQASVEQAHKFGNPNLRQPIFHGAISFAATESQSAYGHMEGALQAGERVAKETIAYMDLDGDVDVLVK